MRQEIPGVVGRSGVASPESLVSMGSPPGQGSAAGQDQCVGNPIIPSSPCAEQETPQGHCQCQCDQDPHSDANDGPHRETCGTSSICMKKKKGEE